MKLSIIVPAHNEEENIISVIRSIEAATAIEHELIIVNDHSSDKTPLLVKELSVAYPNLRLVNNTNGQGFASAIKFGFCQAKGELIIPIMGDLCDDLSSLQPMLNKIREGYDVVCGSRYIKGGRRLGGSKLKGFLSCLGGWSLYYILGVSTHDIANAFKMYRKEVLAAIDIKATGFEISMELALKAYYAGFRITEVPTVWKERQKGKSNFKVFKLLPQYLRLYLWSLAQKLMMYRKKGRKN